MRKHLNFVLILFLLLSPLAACQREEGRGRPRAEASAKPSRTKISRITTRTEEVTSPSLGDDCNNPPSGWESGETGPPPPGFKLDPQEPDKCLYVEEWHG